jgi:hypothetical protein
MRDTDVSGPTSERGGHALDPICTSGLSPPQASEADAEVSRLVQEFANLVAEMFAEGKLQAANDNTETPEPK